MKDKRVQVWHSNFGMNKNQSWTNLFFLWEPKLSMRNAKENKGAYKNKGQPSEPKQRVTNYTKKRTQIPKRSGKGS